MKDLPEPKIYSKTLNSVTQGDLPSMCLGSQSKSIRYENAECSEIGVKYNRNSETIIIVENSKSKSEFIFYPDDDQTLFYFENIFTNMIGFYHTFGMNFGRKQNTTDSKMKFSVINKNNDVLEISAIKDVGIVFEVTIGKEMTKFIFSPSEKNILEMFKLDLANVIKNNGHKLPPISTHVTPVEESLHTFKKL